MVIAAMGYAEASYCWLDETILVVGVLFIPMGFVAFMYGRSQV